MRVHHLNCATMCPACSWLFAPRSPGSRFADHRRARHELVCHCLLIESRNGLVLVDTGLGTRDVDNPRQLGTIFGQLFRPALRHEETAVARVRALGFSPDDVRDIVLTHCDLDHAGGLPDFPNAKVHVMRAEHEAALHPSLRERLRYLPAHWAHHPRWQTHDVRGEKWFGFDSVSTIPGLDDDVLLIPLPGHTRGHSAVAVRAQLPGRHDWLMHCGDAYFSHLELRDPRECPRGLRIFQHVVEVDRKLRLGNQARLRELHSRQAGSIDMFCAHDRQELDRLQRNAFAK